MRSFAVALAVLAPATSAQVSMPWSVAIDGGPPVASETASTVALTPSGDVILAGGRVVPGSPTGSDPFVARIGSDGVVQWKRTDPTANAADGVRGLAVSAVDGSIYALSSPTWFGQAELRLAKYDGTGVLSWQATYPGPVVTTLAGGVVVDAAGNSYVAGAVGSGAGNPAEITDVLLESRDSSGALRWSHRIDGGIGKGDMAKSLAAAPGNEFVASGFVDALQSGASDAWIARFDAAGNVLWTKRRSGLPGQTCSFQDLAVDEAGRAYVLEIVATPPTILATNVVGYDAGGNELFAVTIPAGSSVVDLDARAGAVVVGGSQGQDGFGARYSSTGSFEWVRTWSFGGPATTTVRVRIDAAGDATFAGTIYTLESGIQRRDVSAARIRADGVEDWKLWVGAPGATDEQCLDLAVDANGTSYVVGARHNGTTPGGDDALVLRLDDQAFPLCLGDGTGAACPCGNESALGSQAGCANSSGQGARLTSNGLADLSNDTLRLSVGGETPNAPTVVIQGTVALNSVPFGDGFRCAGGAVRRLYTRTASAGVVSVPAAGDPSVSQRASVLGDVITPGSTRVYQCYYRDPNPLFCARPLGATWNLSSALLVRWSA